MPSPALLWIRQDLRLSDQPALAAAIARGGAVLPVFVWAPEEEEPWSPGAASRWWLHHSLARLAADLEARGSQLVLRRAAPSGDGAGSLGMLRALLRETGAGAVYWNRRYEPAVVARDKAIKQALRESGIEAESFNAALLAEPWDVRNQSGRPFQVFTPFWKYVKASIDPPRPLPAPARVPAPATWPDSLPLEALGLLPRIRWDAGLAASWEPGERGAARQLARFLEGPVRDYGERRNLPGVAGTARLSPHLHFGEVSPRQVWHAAEAWRDGQFVTEVGWREFAHHLLYHFPHTPDEPLRPEFRRFPWDGERAHLGPWQRGRTGVPMVDAGMRELWHSGWMHNRVRMVVASFLVKNLRLPWQDGARWFWDTLVDADLASNTLGWQWTAGCGADAAPYFRVFNPVSQGSKFDADGEYVRRWIPELAKLPAAAIHAPWEADAATLAAAGVALPRSYPRPLVDLRASREAALDAYQRMRK
ncbi:MAG: DNA photolyase family protein [Steroidobacteraceae bacterium]|nr:DNA photolyase family protein [Steroidobacteraceae bacterium]